MHVGKSINIQNLDGKLSDAEIFLHEVELAVEAEAQGFDAIWTAEHHFNGYHMVPNVLQLLTYLAGRTSRVRLGSMSVILPWHEPIRVAEELAVLDNLSGGRLVLGIGRGLGRIEFDGFRLNQGEARQRFLEYADAIVTSFDTGVLEYDGELYKQPPVGVRPAPLSPLRGRTYASAISPESMEIMARLGFGVMIFAQKPWPQIEADIRSYDERFFELNGYGPPRPLLCNQIIVHESEQAAQELFELHTDNYSRSALDHYEFASPALAAIPGYEWYGKMAENVNAHGRDKFVRFLSNLQYRGTPDQVTEQIIEAVRRIDGAGLLAILSFGEMPPEVGRHNQELFAREVLPKLKAEDDGRVFASPARAQA